RVAVAVALERALEAEQVGEHDLRSEHAGDERRREPHPERADHSPTPAKWECPPASGTTDPSGRSSSTPAPSVSVPTRVSGMPKRDPNSAARGASAPGAAARHSS